jgi:hypothetical protein
MSLIFGAFKLIGDVRRGTVHTRRGAEAASGISDEGLRWNECRRSRVKLDRSLWVRIRVNTGGPIIAGVLGKNTGRSRFVERAGQAVQIFADCKLQ